MRVPGCLPDVVGQQERQHRAVCRLDSRVEHFLKELANARGLSQGGGWQVAEDALPDLHGKSVGAAFIALVALMRHCQGVERWSQQNNWLLCTCIYVCVCVCVQDVMAVQVERPAVSTMQLASWQDGPTTIWQLPSRQTLSHQSLWTLVGAAYCKRHFRPRHITMLLSRAYL